VEPATPLPGSEAINREPLKGFTRLSIVAKGKRSHQIAVDFFPVAE
jgi:hypothetical protein